MAVLDRVSAEIRIFDPDGRHVRSMGRRGEGPGEFRSAWKLWVLPGDTLWAGDYRPWRYNVFTRDGQWVRAVQMNPIYGNPSRRGGVLDNGVSVNTVDRSARPRNFKMPDTVVVEVHGPDGERLETLGRIVHRTYGPTGMYQLFTASAVVEAGGSTIALARTNEPEVRLLDDELRLRRVLRWSDSNRNVSGADVRAWRDNYLKGRGPDSPNWNASDNAILRDEVPAADVFPASFLRGDRPRWAGVGAALPEAPGGTRALDGFRRVTVASSATWSTPTPGSAPTSSGPATGWASTPTRWGWRRSWCTG